MERTLVILKPDALARGMVGEVTSRFEKKGLKLVACKMTRLGQEILREHYSHLLDKPFYQRIADFMASLPVVIQCWEGVDAVSVVRKITGVTNGRDADAGTIRGDFAMSVQCNLIHASDTSTAAEAEITRFFKDEELFQYDSPLQNLTYTQDELK